MSRYNSFNAIHKALRAMLYDTALCLQQTDFGNEEEASIALDKLEQIVDAFEKHAHVEDSIVFPTISEYEPDTVQDFEEEHEEDQALAQKLSSLIAVFRHSLSAEAKLETGIILIHSFISFMAFNLEHMGREETILNPILWKYYTDEDILKIHKRIMDQVPPQQSMAAAVWMMRGMNNREIADWLNSVQKTGPAPLLESLYKLAEEVLPAERFELVTRRMGRSVVA